MVYVVLALCCIVLAAAGLVRWLGRRYVELVRLARMLADENEATSRQLAELHEVIESFAGGTRARIEDLAATRELVVRGQPLTADFRSQLLRTIDANLRFAHALRSMTMPEHPLVRNLRWRTRSGTPPAPTEENQNDRSR